MSSTKNFNINSDPKLACTCGHTQCHKPMVKQDVLDMVQLVRECINRPMTITSGGRCSKHPNEIHREKPADHQKLQAVDVRCSTSYERGELIKVAIEVGFNAIGIHPKFVHLGCREELIGKPPLIWLY